MKRSDLLVSALVHVRDAVRPFVVQEVVNAALSYGSDDAHAQNLGHFSVPREVFAVVDHLGSLISDEGSTRRSIAFIQAYFPEFYAQKEHLLLVMWRHGLVHAWQPYSYRAELDGSHITVKWLSSNHDRAAERGNHLLAFKDSSASDTVILVVNTCELAQDLLTAIDNFIVALDKRPELDSKCAERLAASLAIHDLDFVQGKLIREAVEDQMRTSWQSAAGLIADGDVVRPHPDARAAMPNNGGGSSSMTGGSRHEEPAR